MGKRKQHPASAETASKAESASRAEQDTSALAGAWRPFGQLKAKPGLLQTLQYSPFPWDEDETDGLGEALPRAGCSVE